MIILYRWYEKERVIELKETYKTNKKYNKKIKNNIYSYHNITYNLTQFLKKIIVKK